MEEVVFSPSSEALLILRRAVKLHRVAYNKVIQVGIPAARMRLLKINLLQVEQTLMQAKVRLAEYDQVGIKSKKDVKLLKDQVIDEQLGYPTVYIVGEVSDLEKRKIERYAGRHRIELRSRTRADRVIQWWTLPEVDLDVPYELIIERRRRAREGEEEDQEAEEEEEEETERDICVLDITRRRSGVRLQTKNTSGNKKRKVDEVDRISELPDHILGSILSRLSLAEAARTSVVSVRWRDVWIIRDTVLDFHDHRPVTEKHWRSLTSQKQFIDWVDEVLEKHHESTLNEFTVKSDWLTYSSLSPRIYNWIYFAIRKRVRRLDLAPSSADYLGGLRGVGRGLSSSTRYSGHSFPNLNFLLSEVEGFSSFVTTLQVLRLRCFNVDDELLVYLLSNCPVLEHLSVSWSESIVNLEVRAPSVVNLKHFEITDLNFKTIHFDYAPNLECFHCFGFGSVVSVSIKSAPNLKYIACFGSYDKISIESAPNLIDAALGRESGISDSIMHLSNHFSQLEVLTLEVEGSLSKTIGIELDPNDLNFKHFPTLFHLKQLTLKLLYHFPNMDLNRLLRATPSLYRLHLEVEHKMPQLLPKSSRISHECLKLVEWNGFRGDRNDYDVVKLLVATCKVLEKVKITKVTPDSDSDSDSDSEDGVWPYDYDKKGIPEMEKLAMQALEEADVEVILL